MCRVSKPLTQSAVQFSNLSVHKEAQRASPDTVHSSTLDSSWPKPKSPISLRMIAPPGEVHLEPRWHPLPASKRAFQTMAVEPLDPEDIRSIFRSVTEETKSQSLEDDELEESGYLTPPPSPPCVRRRLEPPSPPYPYRTLVEIHGITEDLYLPFV